MVGHFIDCELCGKGRVPKGWLALLLWGAVRRWATQGQVCECPEP